MLLRRFNTVIDSSGKLLQSYINKSCAPLVTFESKKFSTEVTKKEPPKKNMSKAMKAYLERAKEHDEFMRQQTIEFQIGKRHLANMMGEDPNTFTQKDIDEAIAYLFPSGLFEKKARPYMRPPEEVFPQRKAAEFDETGRPFHYLFYTGRPHFYDLMHEIVQHMNDLYKFEDAMIRKGLQPDPNLELDTVGYQWIDKESLEIMLVENIGDKDYESFIYTMNRLINLPYSYRSKDFIMKYRKTLMSATETHEAPKPQYDADGRAFITTYECCRKTARGTVTIRSPGTGLISINGEDLNYFQNVQDREQLLFPLIFSEMLNKVDVEATVTGGGTSGQAGAIRWGIAWGLRSFVDQDMVEKMRIDRGSMQTFDILLLILFVFISNVISVFLAGLLTKDVRTKERKKYGQEKARKKFTWKKR